MRMRRLLFFCLLLTSTALEAQVIQDSIALDCDFFRRKTEKRAMVVLGTWSALNLGTGFVLSQQTTGWESRFHLSNALWNTVNASLAISSLLRMREERFSGNLVAAVNKLHAAEKAFLFNTGLDLAYMATGWYLTEASKNQNEIERRDLFLGAGRSLMLQGGFLFVFDLACFLSIKQINSFYGKMLEGLYVGGNGLGIRKQF